MSVEIAVSARKLRRVFGKFVAVDDVDLEVPRGSIPTAPARPPPSASSAGCLPPAPARPPSMAWTWCATPRA
jgi:hypothetical protein